MTPLRRKVFFTHKNFEVRFRPGTETGRGGDRDLSLFTGREGDTQGKADGLYGGH